MESRPRDLLVDRDRLLQRLEDLAALAPIPGGGVNRLALTDADRAGRDLVTGWMHDLGLDVRVDSIGNVTGLWGERIDRAVMIGSHIDTVRTGGRYDGNYGVLAGLEVVETLMTAGTDPGGGVAVAFFTNEEGARFAPDMLGSLVYAGGMPVEAAHDITGIDGAQVGEELARIGYLGSFPCPGPAPRAYLELHVEQGPVLEAEGFDIGAVTGVQGIWWEEVTVHGQSNHAGTTPMDLRHDAAYVAAEMGVFLRRMANDLGGHQVATMGRIELHPNLTNVVASRATFTLDVRNTDAGVLAEAERRIMARLDELSASERVTIERRTLARFAPVSFDDSMIDRVEAHARKLGAAVKRLPSGAGHDAQMLARICPASMIFVPSANGISHNPSEYTAPEALELGANVLLSVVAELLEDSAP
ncbi:MAG: Zn-dependent hydrolase [Acidimicrobiia bacterium]